MKITLHEKCPNTELSLVRIFLQSVRIRENTDQNKLRIWTLFTQCLLLLEILVKLKLKLMKT